MAIFGGDAGMASAASNFSNNCCAVFWGEGARPASFMAIFGGDAGMALLTFTSSKTGFLVGLAMVPFRAARRAGVASGVGRCVGATASQCAVLGAVLGAALGQPHQEARLARRERQEGHA